MFPNLPAWLKPRAPAYGGSYNPTKQPTPITNVPPPSLRNLSVPDWMRQRPNVPPPFANYYRNNNPPAWLPFEPLPLPSIGTQMTSPRPMNLPPKPGQKYKSYTPVKPVGVNQRY